MICARCLYPDEKPDLHFDGGVCAACRAFDKRAKTDWRARRRELEIVLEDGRNGTGYDCIVPSSGGKDSHFQVLTLLDMGARPLVVTARTCHLTDMGRRNIDNLARYATTIEVAPNLEVRAKLNRLGLEMVGDISWPEHVSIFTTPFRVANDLGIPLVFFGECPQEAYGGPPGTEAAREMTQRWVQEYGGFLGLRPQDMVGVDGITDADMADYRAPESVHGVTAYFLGQFVEWDSHRNADVAIEHGMEYPAAGPSVANWWPWENLDNAQTGLHDYFGWLKYGYGRACAQASVDVRAGRLDRDTAAEIVAARDGVLAEEYMGVPLDDILGRIGIDRGQLRELADAFRC